MSEAKVETFPEWFPQWVRDSLLPHRLEPNNRDRFYTVLRQIRDNQPEDSRKEQLTQLMHDMRGHGYKQREWKEKIRSFLLTVHEKPPPDPTPVRVRMPGSICFPMNQTSARQ